ncbi:MAG: IS21-like element helper ATPase IstB [Candidatus Eremiobacterota bacterium]
MEELFSSLKLHRMKEVYKDYIEKAGKEEMGYGEFLRMLLQDEQIYRQEKSMRRRLRQAGFPYEKTIDQFDFHLRPELHKQVFLNYLEDSFITNGRTLCLIGPAGLGKTHLGVAIGIKHIIRGYDVRFFTVQALMNKILQLENNSIRQREINLLLKCDLLILDELGYLPLNPAIGPILYQIVAGRYEKRPLIITSNKSLVEWGNILQDASLATALVDRLLHHGEVFYLSGESYRLRGKKITTSAPSKESLPKKSLSKV